jgi:hypothetical protein
LISQLQTDSQMKLILSTIEIKIKMNTCIL